MERPANGVINSIIDRNDSIHLGQVRLRFRVTRSVSTLGCNPATGMDAWGPRAAQMHAERQAHGCLRRHTRPAGRCILDESPSIDASLAGSVLAPTEPRRPVPVGQTPHCLWLFITPTVTPVVHPRSATSTAKPMTATTAPIANRPVIHERYSNDRDYGAAKHHRGRSGRSQRRVHATFLPRVATDARAQLPRLATDARAQRPIEDRRTVLRLCNASRVRHVCGGQG